jgi:hypothetical protein
MADGLLNKASIILTPTGYKAGTLYNVAPVVEPYEDFDFTRASVASRVNSSGLVEMVGRALGSELVTNGDFSTDSDWSSTNSTINILNGVCQINPTSVFGYLNSTSSFETIIGETYVYSFDCINRIGSGNVYMQIGTFQNGNNVTNQNIGSIEDNTSYSIYFTATSTTSYLRIGFGGSGTSATIDNVSVKEIIDTNNIPRISYDSNGDNGHILLEPTSTNLVTYSNDFEQWQSVGSITINSNFATSPDGTQNASRLQWTNATNFIYQSLSHIGNDHTLSIYMKSNTASSQSVRLFMDNGAQGQDANVTTEWQRFTFSNSSATTQSNRNVGLIKSGTQVGDLDILIAFAQFEALPYATSYIPTLTGSQEVRATETATGAGSADLINSTEGVLYAEIAALANDGTTRRISLSDGSTSNRVSLELDETSNKIKAFISSGGVSQILEYTASDLKQYNKIAIKYKANDFALWLGGVERDTDVSGSVPIGLNTLEFAQGSGSQKFYGKCKALAVFNEALSDSELTQLTT